MSCLKLTGIIKWSKLDGDFELNKLLMAETDNTCGLGHLGELGELGSISKLELGKLHGRYSLFFVPPESLDTDAILIAA